MYEETLLVKGMKQESPIIIKNVQIMYKGGYLAVLNFRKIDRWEFMKIVFFVGKYKPALKIPHIFLLSTIITDLAMIFNKRINSVSILNAKNILINRNWNR